MSPVFRADGMKWRTEMKIKQQEGEPEVAKEILAQAIIRMSDALVSLKKSGINEKAIIVLVHDAIPGNYSGKKVIGKRDIKAVFDALAELKERYTR